jgi:hypothetical protein
VEAADDHALVDVGNELLDLVGCHERHIVDPPRLCRGHPASQLLHALLGARHLDAAADGEHAEFLVLPQAVGRQLRHLARVVDREDEVRGVARRSAGVRQRALVDQDHVLPAEVREVAEHAVADDAGADHDALGLGGEGTCGAGG